MMQRQGMAREIGLRQDDEADLTNLQLNLQFPFSKGV